MIRASRDFVCVRLTTYENAEETEFMRGVYSSRSGNVENTTFSILTPDGTKSLVTPGRSPNWSFRNASVMASEMKKIAQRYVLSKRLIDSSPPLPVAADVRLGVNIAAGDNVPVAVLYADTEQVQKALVERVSRLAWQSEFIGRFSYAVTANSEDLKLLGQDKAQPGILIARPGKFGMSATLLCQVGVDASDEEVAAAMREAADQFEPLVKEPFRSHVNAGIENSIYWETNLPVTDSMESRARQRTKQQIDSK